MDFVVGQRWVSQTESELGLGVVVAIDGRHITVRFPAADEDRVYAQNNSPLARVVYHPGDAVRDLEQREYTVRSAVEEGGLVSYVVEDEEGHEELLGETLISGQIQLSSPRQRLFSGQFDRRSEYELKVEALERRHQLELSGVRGLLGTRTSLLAHQIYIATEVASRFAPRVLLADEVGLGKTIEAGMIVHRQLVTGLAGRVLIVVPDALVHQWLVEMLRKFNLHFALFDNERITANNESGEGNPFETEQLVLCGQSLLMDEAVANMAEAAGWDLLVVDEAHHLAWAKSAPSREYVVIEALARHCAGVLLLTATPEQLGPEGHFARLHLLDPARFSSLDAFLEEQHGYAALNDAVEVLRADGVPSEADRRIIEDATGARLDGNDPDALVRGLLDRHGTGRVLFRNTRAAISGFPVRRVQGYPLTGDPLAEGADASWVRRDPRVRWLQDFFAAHPRDKVLIICASADVATDLERHLHLNVGIRSAAFYEDLSIVERDRAAAYFAEAEGGAQALICSEIGSEGRNFQFAHNLVLFDLPKNPDLLEQRIGRLDRIGQTQDVQIHVPFVADTDQAILFRWYHEGLDAFESSFSAGASVRTRFAAELDDLSGAGAAADDVEVDDLIERTAVHVAEVRETLKQGRDRLLELNSCDPEVAAASIAEIERLESDGALEAFMTRAFDVFAIDTEPHSDHALVLRQSEHSLDEGMLGIDEDGLTVTFDRATAIEREDMVFLSWEAPVVSGLVEMLVGSEFGNTAISTIRLQAIPAGTLLVEAYYAVHATAPKRYQLGRYLPATPVRLLLDSDGRDLAQAITHEQLSGLCQHVGRSKRPAIIKEIRPTLERMLKQGEELAAARLGALRDEAEQRVAELLGGEIERLRHLQAVNPAVRDDEIEFFVDQRRHVQELIELAALEPQAMRVVITV